MDYNYNNLYKLNNQYCVNCNKWGHYQKRCNLPKISNGLISFQINNFEQKKMKQLENFIYKKFLQNKSELINDLSNNLNLNDINKDIKFLIVQRKKSLGYIEFIRGKYDVNKLNCEEKDEILNNPSVNYLIKQMTPDEIDDILNKEFDDLWLGLWNSSGIHNNYQLNEFTMSKNKFYTIRMKYKKEELMNSKYLFNEWGFPKGRRIKYENDVNCALREFEEETSINKIDLNVFNKCKYLRENMKGTNGIDYIHNYFIAYLNTFENHKIDNHEIGDIKLVSLDECLKMIRPYHIEKIKIIKTIYCIINEFLQENDKIFI